MVRKPGSARFVAFLVLSFILAVPGFAQSSSDASGADTRAEAIVKQMTIEEKIDYIGGVDGFFIRAVPRVGVPRLKMADGPIGVRNFGPATTMAGGIALAATWNPELARLVGSEIGRDARAKGVHFLLGPGVNIYMAPMNGRNFEYFGEDPFLASRIAVGYIQGVQQTGVSATVKHYMGNNSEFDRHNVDVVVDERAEREIYLPVFEAAVKEGKVGAIMDSYNLTNGAHMTQNGYLNTEVAKKQWRFPGIIMSDWTATYDAVAAANGGLDLEMPYGKIMNRGSLLPAIQDGKIATATIDDKVRRILRTAIAFGWLDRDQADLSISRYNQQGRQAAVHAALESMVLLKNNGRLLPVPDDRTKSIAVIGPDAHPAQPVGGGSARVVPFSATSFLEGFGYFTQLASYRHTTVYYERGLPTLSEMAEATRFQTAAANGAPGLTLELFNNAELSGTPVITRIEQRVNYNPGFDGTTLSAAKGYSMRWTGYYLPESAGTHYIFVQGPGEGGGYRLFVDGKLVIDNWRYSIALAPHVAVSLTAEPHKIVLEQYRNWKFERTRIRMGIAREGTLVEPEAKAVAAKADLVVLAVGFDPETESEGADRTFSLPVGQDELIREIAAANKKTLVVITSGGGVDMSGWLDQVPAVIQAWYPGQEGGRALAGILLGYENPSGRLPVTFERRWDDNPAHDSYYPEAGSNRVVYKDGIFVGYRGYEHNHTKPLFPFGFGLSYTTFKYANLAIKPLPAGNGASGLYEVSFDITNTGNLLGAEVAQVYVGDSHAKLPRPVKELKGFAKVLVRSGETQRVTIPLDARSFSYYDANSEQWHADPGEFDILVGRSVEQIELKGKITLAQPINSAP